MIKGFLITLVIVIFGGIFFVLPKMVGQIVRENNEQKNTTTESEKSE